MSIGTAVTKANGNGGAKLSDKAIKTGPDGKPVIDWAHIDSQIEYGDHKIILPGDPEKMPLQDAITALQRKLKDEEQMMDVHEVIEAFPTDGAVAFTMALKKKYGWASPVPVPGFFGPEPPQMLTVEIGPGPEDQVQVPWGGFRVPGIESIVQTHSSRGEFGPVFIISSKLRKKESYLLKDLANLTRQIVKERSIYRGKAIRLRTDEDGELEVSMPPKFIDTAHIKPDELILGDDVLAEVETNIFTLIKHTDACINANVPLKRGVLLSGKYGTGKTMTASVTAKHCVDNGWTYITLDKCQGLADALHFARRYEPAVIFAEDIDRMTEDRDEPANDLLNILDGVLSKNSKVLTVLTTNHIEKINQAMLRPGRLDAVITVLPPDAGAVAKLITMYGRGLLADDITLAAVSDMLAGNIPAVVREVVERSKLAMISRGGARLVEDDLLISARNMRNHLKLLEDPVNPKPTPEQLIGQGLTALVRDALELDTLEEAAEQTKRYAEPTYEEAHAANAKARQLVENAKRDGPRIAETLDGVKELRAKAKV